jgi:hypothetical protein
MAQSLHLVRVRFGPETHDSQDLEIDASLVWAGADLSLPDSGYSVGLNRRRKWLTARGSNKEDSHATGSCDDD